MVGENRRRDYEESVDFQKSYLNLVQLVSLRTLEQFGWNLRFVRHDPPSQPIAVIFDPDKDAYATLDELGDLHEQPNMKFREAPGDRRSVQRAAAQHSTMQLESRAP